MNEGVVAIDRDGNLLKINRAARKLFNVADAGVEGRNLLEVIRNADLHAFVDRALEADDMHEAEIVLFAEDERFLQVHGTPLHGAKGETLGTLIVLKDVTRLRRLETARSEFAANVSHELRTPITSILGYVETLEDGAIESPEDAKRFLAVISRQSRRLKQLIDDLLSLSRIEQQAESGQLEAVWVDLRALAEGAAHICQDKADEAGVHILVTPGEACHASVNIALMRQAVVNLVDNAVKYSEAGGAVDVRLRQEDGAVRIDVADHGRGIEKKHLSRLFERFYRADEARTRQKGGTGLGLAIVKHVMRVHGGNVSVESTVGKGSIFTLHVPVGEPDESEHPLEAHPAPGPAEQPIEHAV